MRKKHWKLVDKKLSLVLFLVEVYLIQIGYILDSAGIFSYWKTDNKVAASIT